MLFTWISLFMASATATSAGISVGAGVSVGTGVGVGAGVSVGTVVGSSVATGSAVGSAVSAFSAVFDASVLSMGMLTQAAMPSNSSARQTETIFFIGFSFICKIPGASTHITSMARPRAAVKADASGKSSHGLARGPALRRANKKGRHFGGPE